MGQVDLKKDDSIWAPDNPYTYRININHPKISPLYARFKKWRGVPAHIPLSDKERFEFERYITANALKRQTSIRAFTVCQPYASAIILGMKQYISIHTAARTNIRGRVAIHAAEKELSEVLRGLTNEQRDKLLTLYHHQPPLCKEMIYRGAVIGTVELVDCVPVREIFDSLSEREQILGDYSPGRFAWVLRNPIKFLSPVPAQGQQGWWRWEPPPPRGR